MEQLRLYTFINFYLSPIQQGIQTAHIVHELFNKYSEDFNINKPLKDGNCVLSGHLLDEWSRKHKTIIVLNAGIDADIEALKTELKKQDFPWEEFREDEGLCGARTGIGVVLPQRVWDVKLKYEEHEDGRFRTPYYEHYRENDDGSDTHIKYYPGDKYYPLIDLIKSKRLA